ncbi:WASH complex subunit 4 isoform X2 [Belonocnema kinseyi]|nr:WASH complex subunit 4 isoform X2 [Belonocnema kinseyi]
MRSVAHNTTQFPVPEFRLQIFENLLKDLHHQLLLKTLFLKAMDRAMDINKNSVMSDNFMSYLRNTLADIENKNSENYPFDKNWARLNVGIVVASKLFGANDRKLIKRIHEVNKKFYALTLAGNVVWIPNKLLEDCLPKDVVSSIGSQVGEKILTMRTQKLQAVANSLIHRAMLWSIEVQSALFKSGFQVLQIERQCFLLSEVLTIMGLIKENVLFVTNLHAALSKPMTRNSVQLICRLIEVQKCLETTFHTLGPVIVQSQCKVLQQVSYHVLRILDSIRKGLTQKDKGYRRERLDALSLIGLSMRLMGGPATADRRLIVRCALVCAFQLSESFKEEEVAKLRLNLDNYDSIAELYDRVSEVCDYSVLLHHRSMVSAYFSSVLDSNLNISHIVHLLDAFNTALSRQEESELIESKISEQRQLLMKNILEPACSREIEMHLRLHVQTHFKPDSTNPFKIGAKNSSRIVRSSPLPINDNLICVKRFIENYLDDMFYNLTTVALHDWKTYGTMHALAKYKLGLDTVRNHLPTQTLEQGLDALEIMRNIHVFVSKYLYNLHTQTFIEHTSTSKHLNTIGIRHIANSIRTHGNGIMSTTVNFVYQFLRIKLNTFSQFLFDEHIKSRLMRDIRFIKSQRESGGSPYTYERAEKFQKGIRKLGMTADGLSYLDQFRQLITHIGNALGYVRLIRSGGLHACSNAISFLPNINSKTPFEAICKEFNYSTTTQAAARRLEDDIVNLVTNFTEGIQYFKLLVDVFSSAFRDVKSYHLQQFYAIVPPLTLSFVDNAVSNKEKLFKKDKTGAAFTDDGFAMGIAYINALLDQSNELDGLQWFETVNQHIKGEKTLAESKADHEDEKLQQTRALSLKRLAERNAEYQLLYYSLSGARVFFKQSDS